MNELFRFSNAVEHSPAVEEWLSGEPITLYNIAREWFTEMRGCSKTTRELIHDGCPVACVKDAAFAYVNVFKSHVNVGFFLGAYLNDPKSLLEGTGKHMRHIKIKPDSLIDKKAVRDLIKQAYKAVKSAL